MIYFKFKNVQEHINFARTLSIKCLVRFDSGAFFRWYYSSTYKNTLDSQTKVAGSIPTFSAWEYGRK